MKYLDEFRDPGVAKKLVARIRGVAEKLDRPVRIMEICGGHTVALCRYGIHDVLPATIRLVSGPGCPVCVTPGSVIDASIWLARRQGVRVFTFGDMMRVPGGQGSLSDAAAAGRKVQMIYSPMQAVEYAAEHRDTACILLGIGFETTAPTLAAAVKSAAAKDTSNFHFLAAAKLTPPAMRALLEDEEVALDAFIAPGHVTTVTGANAYKFIEQEFKKPCVVSGFELCDLLESLARIVEQIVDGRHEVEIQYTRSVTFEGNRKALQIIDDVFVAADDTWRGLGTIPSSGYRLRGKYAACDARAAFNIPAFPEKEPPDCRCGDVLRGVCTPPECGLFGAKCTPDHPVGPCMVSSEGSCAAHYRYGVSPLESPRMNTGL